jgi:hypothetical protein
LYQFALHGCVLLGKTSFHSLIASANVVMGSGASLVVLMVLGLVSAFEMDVLEEPKESTLPESIFSSILCEF